MTRSICILCGEASGDNIGAGLMTALRRMNPNLHYWGIGGPKMRDQGFEARWNMEEMNVMGFTDVIKAFPRIRRLFYQVRDAILAARPEVVVFIDYPGFNLRLQKALRKKGFKGKLVQYVCPTVWIWGKGRIAQMERDLDHLLCLFPFEKELFNPQKLEAAFVGHPVAWAVREYQPSAQWQPIPQPLLGIFPGSRPSELRFNLERLLHAAKEITSRHPHLQVALSVASPAFLPTIQAACEQAQIAPILVPASQSHDLMANCSSALAVSGTVCLELAFHEVPTVVVYDTTRFNRFVAKYLLRVKLPYYCMVNILSRHEVFPEFMARPYTASLIAAQVETLFEPKKIDSIRHACQELKRQFLSCNPNEQAASSVAALL